VQQVPSADGDTNVCVVSVFSKEVEAATEWLSTVLSLIVTSKWQRNRLNNDHVHLV